MNSKNPKHNKTNKANISGNNIITNNIINNKSPTISYLFLKVLKSFRISSEECSSA